MEDGQTKVFDIPLSEVSRRIGFHQLWPINVQNVLIARVYMVSQGVVQGQTVVLVYTALSVHFRLVRKLPVTTSSLSE